MREKEGSFNEKKICHGERVCACKRESELMWKRERELMWKRERERES